MRVGVSHSVEDRMMLEELLETADIHSPRCDQQKKPNRDRQPSPGQSAKTAAVSAERARAA